MVRENQRDNDTDRYELAAQSRQVAGAAERNPGLEAHRSKRPTRLRSPKQAPVPDHPNLRTEPDRASHQQFHASTTRSRNSPLVTGPEAGCCRRRRSWVRCEPRSRLALTRDMPVPRLYGHREGVERDVSRPERLRLAAAATRRSRVGCVRNALDHAAIRGAQHDP